MDIYIYIYIYMDQYVYIYAYIDMYVHIIYVHHQLDIRHATNGNTKQRCKGGTHALGGDACCHLHICIHVSACTPI